MRYSLLLPLLLLLACSPTLAAEKLAVSVPIRLDYPLLRQLLVKQLFTGPQQSRKVVSDANSCNQVVLNDPRIAPQDANLEIHAQVTAQLGVSLFGFCYELLEWNGSVGFLGLPVLKAGGTAMGLKPQGMWLTNEGGDRITSGRMWDYAREPLQNLFSSFTVNLAPFSAALGSLLPDVLPNRSASQLQDTLDSLKLGSLKISADSLTTSLDFSVEPVAEPLSAEDVLSPEELQQWESRWQMMDSLLVFAVKRYAAATRMEALRSTLIDILIDSRYQLVEALAAPSERANDAVRLWFLDSWQKLSPVVRRIALQQEGKEPLMWISVLAATDALYALDQLGPRLGFEISADGLRRLARMINQGVEPGNLDYDEAVDPELQELFQQQMEHRGAEPSAWNINFSLVPRAHAESPAMGLNGWVPDEAEIGDYVPLVHRLLDESADSMLKKHQLEKAYHGLYRKLVLATAWQESCWRQYVEQDGRVEPLLSSTGDVGLMQMNERVWRGFYDLQKLRWDIDYNSIAGAEVLMDYLKKYAIRRNEHKQPGGLDNLARSSYSAYNGGPGKASRYRQENVPAYHRKIDTAFWKKYQRIHADEQTGVARCLGSVS